MSARTLFFLPHLHIARSSRSAHNKTAHDKIAHDKTARRHPPQAVHLISAQFFPLLWHRITLSEYRPEVKLLQFNLSTGSFQLSLDFFGFSLRSAFLNSLRSTVNQVFGFFQTQRGNAADFLNNVNFVSAGFNEDNVEFGLFFSCGSSTAGITPHDPAVGDATMRRMQAFDSAMDSACTITSSRNSPPMLSPRRA